eukprot:1218777-Rhodomonas_salina.1
MSAPPPDRLSHVHPERAWSQYVPICPMLQSAKPELHAHVKLPSVLEQVASGSQFWDGWVTHPGYSNHSQPSVMP